MKSNLMTADELAHRPDCVKHCQLIRGELIRTEPTYFRHGLVTGELLLQLANHNHDQKLGTVYAPETGFHVERDPDTVLAPDAAFVSKVRLTLEAKRHYFLPFAPDFVAEVRAHWDSVEAMQRKAAAWLDAGCKLVLTVDPTDETVCRYIAPDQKDTFQKNAPVDCTAGVPGWIVDTTELFAD